MIDAVTILAESWELHLRTERKADSRRRYPRCGPGLRCGVGDQGLVDRDGGVLQPAERPR